MGSTYQISQNESSSTTTSDASVGMCWKCKQSVPEPRITKPEILKADLNNVLVKVWCYFKCPSCKIEWADTQSLEIVTEDGTALTSLPKRYKQHGYDPSSLPQMRDPKLSQNPRGILQKLLSETERRISYLPEQGKGEPTKMPKMQRKAGNN